MYAVKVGDYYVRDMDDIRCDAKHIYIREIILSREIMGHFTKPIAELIAKKINGKLMEVGNDKYKK